MTRTHMRIGIVLTVLALVAAACSSQPASKEVVLLTHTSFALSESVLESFTQQTGLEVVVQTSGDAGTMINQAILTKDNPIADVIFGIDNTFLSRAIDSEIFTPYTPADIVEVDDQLRISGDIVTPIDFGDVCVNYDIASLEALGVPPPTSIDELTDPRYEDMLVVEDPATSSPGLAFLLATIDAFPEGSSYDWKAYWADLFDNGVSVASGWSEAYTTLFSQSGGDRPLVVSYASSPPAEVLFGELTEAPTGIVTDGCFRQIEYAGVLSGASNEAGAEAFIDFLLSRPVQEDIPLNMFVYPARRGIDLPPVFEEFTVLPDAPTLMDPDMIDSNRERWIQEWTELARS
ncbi:Thiamin ABC transporter, substrate-binding component [hydrothermal vent metagenome]|uniref:Thiamin ABC transporter, substrate-binding component n=1 Tax=hydrothermal vent metagenome TaxID=652676 RepID=A0A3B0SBM4_9ZZZZ